MGNTDQTERQWSFDDFITTHATTSEACSIPRKIRTLLYPGETPLLVGYFASNLSIVAMLFMVFDFLVATVLYTLPLEV